MRRSQTPSKNKNKNLHYYQLFETSTKFFSFVVIFLAYVKSITHLLIPKTLSTEIEGGYDRQKSKFHNSFDTILDSIV